MRVSITSDDVRLGSTLNIIQALIFSKRPFICTILGFTHSHQGPLNDIQRFYQFVTRKI